VCVCVPTQHTLYSPQYTPLFANCGEQDEVKGRERYEVSSFIINHVTGLVPYSHVTLDLVRFATLIMHSATNTLNGDNSRVTNSPVFPGHVLFSRPVLTVLAVMKMSWLSKNCWESKI